MRRLKLWKYVEPGTPPAAPSAEWSNGDEDALTTIQLVVEESQQSVIRDKVTAKATWEALKEHHSKLRLGQMVSIIIQIATQNYQDGDSMETYLSSIEKLYARLDNAGVRMQECIKVGLILRGLPPSYRPLIMALEARDEEDLTLAMEAVRRGEQLPAPAGTWAGQASAQGENPAKGAGVLPLR